VQWAVVIHPRRYDDVINELHRLGRRELVRYAIYDPLVPQDRDAIDVWMGPVPEEGPRMPKCVGCERREFTCMPINDEECI
jgi:hypothetical protein